ncbi:MAG: LysR substrate-binding domain-containing protein [Beijerinckiaceae bacterium]|nr:LysR substrate-binding domain-containing protein [Beijerinckiaceae bacterium]
MNLRDLRYIVAVAEHGQFGRAAQACAVSQPTLSGQILKLEKELGIELFERAGRVITVTNAGAPILDHARRAVAAADDVLAAAARQRDPNVAPLRIGIIPTLAPYLMPLLLPLLRIKLPSLHLLIVEDLTTRIVERVLHGDLDAALIASDLNAQGLRLDRLFEEPFWLVAPINHPLAAKTTVAAADIDVSSLMLLLDGHCLRDQALALCHGGAAAGENLADMRATSLETLLQMADAGYGLTLLPHLAVARDAALPRNVVARPLTGDQTSRVVRMASRAGTPRRGMIDSLAGLTRESVARKLPAL